MGVCTAAIPWLVGSVHLCGHGEWGSLYSGRAMLSGCLHSYWDMVEGGGGLYTCVAIVSGGLCTATGPW